MDEDELLAIFGDDRATAEKKLEQLRAALTWYFERHGAMDAADLAQETIVRGWASLRRGKVIECPNPQSYFFGFARNVRFENGRKRVGEELAEDPRDTRGTYMGMDRAELAVLVREIIEMLSEFDQAVLRAHLEGKRQLAPLSAEAFRVRVFRIRRKITQQIWPVQEKSAHV